MVYWTPPQKKSITRIGIFLTAKSVNFEFMQLTNAGVAYALEIVCGATSSYHPHTLLSSTVIALHQFWLRITDNTI
jgi:hypothetical protein